MTATEQKWAERVESWRESGLTSEQYSDGRGFSANGLRHWAYKLGKTERRRPTVEVPEVRIVRIVRATATAPTPASMAASSAPTHADPSLGIEVGPVRVVVRPGFDRATLVAVLDVLASHGGTR